MKTTKTPAQNNLSIIESPLGKLGIRVEENHLARIHFLPENTPLLSPFCQLSKAAVQQLNLYFSNPKITFEIPFKLKGTAFQQRIWHYLAQMKSGSTITYGELAELFKTSPRAIGNACRTNPIPIIIPCHRVLAKNDMGGFMGQTAGVFTEIKRYLLKHELTL